MGMNKKHKGIYNSEDHELIRFESKTEKIKKLNKLEIKNRLKNFGIKGYTKFLFDKSMMTWSDGTYFAPEKLRREIIKESVIHKYILSNGEKHYLYFNFSQTVHYILMLFIVFASLKQLLSKKILFDFIPLLSLFGLFLFLLIWETRSRYLINFIPIIVISAVIGFDYLMKSLYYCFIKIKGEKNE